MMSCSGRRKIAHNVSDRDRSEDVAPSSIPTFEAMLLSRRTLMGLTRSGFQTPSPIQAKAIPMAKCGVDMIVQAKSGTGKTCIFAVIALEMINVQLNEVQVIILAPTREIAIQICDNINCIGVEYPGLKSFAFIGGIALEQDKVKIRRCHIFVGTPGRTKQLIQVGLLKTRNVRLFVLDEADKLLEKSFHDDINAIYAALPVNKQMLALSATFPSQMVEQLSKYMRAPTTVRLNNDDPALLGIRQFYHTVPHHNIPHIVFQRKLKVLLQILVDVPYTQCLVFMNYQLRAEMLRGKLCELNLPCELLSGAQHQSERISSLIRLKQNKCRILVTTDLAARGIDAEKVSLVINFEVPNDKETYLHRMGRAGRYGSFGISISIVTEGKESDCLKKNTDNSNIVLHYIGTLRDFRHILTVTNDPVSATEDKIINQVKYPAAELTPEQARQTPLNSGSNCSSRAESRASSRGPSRRSSLRRKQDIRNFVTQSEPCTPFKQRSHSTNSMSLDPEQTSLSELHLMEKVQKALTPSCEDVNLRSIDEALESLANILKAPRLHGSLVWQPVMPLPEISPTAAAEVIIPEEGESDDESLQENPFIQLGSLSSFRPVSPMVVPPLGRTQLSQSLSYLNGFLPSLPRQNSLNPFRLSDSASRWESQTSLASIYDRYIKGMVNGRNDYFQRHL